MCNETFLHIAGTLEDKYEIFTVHVKEGATQVKEKG